MANKVSHHGGMASVHAESNLAHSGKPTDTAIGWMKKAPEPVKHAGRALVDHVGGTDVKHHSHAGGGLLRGLHR